MLGCRCKMLDERGHTPFPADSTETLEAATRHGSEVIHTSNQLSSRRAY